MIRERDERMWEEAHRLADTGEYGGGLELEWELRQQGFSWARQLLDDEQVRHLTMCGRRLAY